MPKTSLQEQELAAWFCASPGDHRVQHAWTYQIEEHRKFHPIASHRATLKSTQDRDCLEALSEQPTGCLSWLDLILMLANKNHPVKQRIRANPVRKLQLLTISQDWSCRYLV
ncbi:MAG: hypothetical protein GY914_07695, partial [Prochlorococcus sp.]|nr:hypothetical protein [Prochlorococcus sp.]